MQLDHTHDPARRSWVDSANAPSADFPIQNLPFGVFHRQGHDEPFRGGVAIGDQIVDLAAAQANGCFEGVAQRAAAACSGNALNDFLAMGPAAWRDLRHSLSGLLQAGASAQTVERLRPCLAAQSEAIHSLPVAVGDYTDFYTSIDHATNVGKLVRPNDPLTPNFQWMPIAYHGRSSSLCVSGQEVRRPNGQRREPAQPGFGACQRLDYEMELGVYVGTGNAQGVPVPIRDAEQHLFGMCLLNDWSARDIQFWETAPLGPFLGKNFATSVSPWVVTMEALAPYRRPWSRKTGDPQPLAYLDAPGIREAGAIDIDVQVWLQTAAAAGSGARPTPVSRTSFAHQYWTVAQMLTHHTVGGCNLRAGDLFGTGTISGPTAQEAGCLMELTAGGTRPLQLPNGEQRTFLQDGDTVILKASCERDGFVRIGFGECIGTVAPAVRPS